MSGQHHVRVTFEDGNTLETSISGTPSEIQRYYLGNVEGFQFGDTDEHPADKLVRAVAVTFLAECFDCGAAFESNGYDDGLGLCESCLG